MSVVESDSATLQSSWCARGAELVYGKGREDEEGGRGEEEAETNGTALGLAGMRRIKEKKTALSEGSRKGNCCPTSSEKSQ